MQVSARQITDFRATIDKVVNMLSERAINVTQQGVRAYVMYADDGSIEKVNIPNVPDTADSATLDTIRGYIDHEVAHVLFTVPEQRPPHVHAGHPDMEQIHSLYNILEDTRIEREMQGRFPGSTSNMESTMRFVFDRVVKANLKTDPDKFGNLLMPLMRAWSGQRVAQEFLSEVKGEQMIADQIKLLEPFKSRVPTLTSTRDSTDLAMDILAALKAASVPPPPSAQPEQSDKGEPDEPDQPDQPDQDKQDKGDDKPEQDESEKDESEKDESEKDEGEKADEGEKDEGEKADESEGDESEETEGESEEGEEGEGEESDDDAGDAGKSGKSGKKEGDAEADESQDQGDGDGDSSPASESDNAKNEMALKMITSMGQAKDGDDATAALITMMLKQSISKHDYLPFTTDNDETVKVVPNQRALADIDHKIVEVDTRMRAVVGQVQAQMRRLFAQQAQTALYGGQRRGRLQASALHRLTTGDDRIFARRETHEATDTAISLLIDLSGSMCGAVNYNGSRTSDTKLKIACETAYVFSQILDRLGIQHEIAGFTNAMADLSDETITEIYEQQKKLGRPFSRWTEKVMFYVFKEFDERSAHAVRQRLISTAHRQSNVDCASNIDGESVQMAAARLIRRREPRKVLIVLSDGQPAADAIGLNEHLRKVVKDCEKMGIETIGIGIADAAVKSYYPKHVVITDATQLPGEVMGQLRRLLIDKKATL